MPNTGVEKILGNQLPHPETGNGIPRCELHLYADDIESAFRHAMDSGAQLISPVTESDWGDTVCYFAYPDGHFLAFARKTVSNS